MAERSKRTKAMSQAELVRLTAEKDYVPESAGLSLGAQGPDVARLQHYLLDFGYMQAPNLEPFENASRNVWARRTPRGAGRFRRQHRAGVREFSSSSTVCPSPASWTKPPW